MTSTARSLRMILIKSSVVHTATYFLVGLIAYTLFDYGSAFTTSGLEMLMRPTNDPLVTAGPLFQPIRGLLFGIAFYLFQRDFFERKDGWLRMWSALVIVGIISTFGPAPGSIEGLIYTTLPFKTQLSPGILEVLIQSLLLSLLVHTWVNNPDKKWLSWILWVLFGAAILLPAAGILAAGMGA